MDNTAPPSPASYGRGHRALEIASIAFVFGSPRREATVDECLISLGRNAPVRTPGCGWISEVVFRSLLIRRTVPDFRPEFWNWIAQFAGAVLQGTHPLIAHLAPSPPLQSALSPPAGKGSLRSPLGALAILPRQLRRQLWGRRLDLSRLSLVSERWLWSRPVLR